MFLLEKEVERFRRGDWEVDCVSMTLTQNGAQPPAQFVGQGYLRQNEAGTIRYQIYPTTVTNVSPHAGLQPIGVPGVIIGADRFYRLEAVAQDGICWEVERTIPEMGGSFIGGIFHHLVGGAATEMRFSRPFPVPLPKFYLTMVFFVEAKIPCNARTETTTVIGGEQRHTSSNLDLARFGTRFGEFRVSRREGMVVVEIEADAAFPAHFESRVTEALMFVLTKPLYWNVIERFEGGTEAFRVRGAPQVIDARLPRPVTGPYEDIDTTGEVWRLFEKYLALVCTHPGANFHPCSRHLFGVLEASAGGITARGLALGVAAEGIAKEMFPAAGAPMAGMNTLVAPLRAHCLAWGGFPAGELGESVKKRLPGMIGQLLNVSTKDKLHALAKEKAIYEAHIKSWSDLRNTLAHGVTPGSADIQKLFDLCQQVTVLMYHLIFKAAGYEGLYEDYSAYGWPTKRYRGRAVTEQEITVAAYFIYEKTDRSDGHDIEHWFAGKEQLEAGLA
jgi:hypothetical protein